ncbi:MAG: tyrosine-type recombinase/integrase [Bacteroidales bacterium]|nr:tyrosine-type recombinase/integrase [Bacteroidales bacterium]
MATNFYLESRTDKKGLAPIRVSISIAGARLVTSSGVKINPGEWSAEKNEPKKSAPAHVKTLLAQINLHFSEYENRVNASRAPFSKEDLKKEWQSAFGKTKPTNEDTEPKPLTLLDVMAQFVNEGRNDWSDTTARMFTQLKNNLIGAFGENPNFENLNTEGLNKFVTYLKEKSLRNTTVEKMVKLLKWLLRWASARGHNFNNDFMIFAPKLKTAQKKVIFLDWSELMKLYNYEIPANGTEVELTDCHGKKYTKIVREAGALAKTRDIFCFCAFTSLRYSDATNLKSDNISNGVISLTTIKTSDSITIELNKYAAAILKKYKGTTDGRALPPITNQRMNVYIKDICELCGINDPVTQTYYIGNTRYDETKPKYELIGTHAARRTFVCNALMLGIPSDIVMKWTGHSDYKTMRPYIDITNKAKAKAMALFDEI